jgi:hypothetical protein
MSVIPWALENPSLDGGFWQIRTFAATWLNGIFWSRAAGSGSPRRGDFAADPIPNSQCLLPPKADVRT